MNKYGANLSIYGILLNMNSEEYEFLDEGDLYQILEERRFGNPSDGLYVLKFPDSYVELIKEQIMIKDIYG